MTRENPRAAWSFGVARSHAVGSVQSRLRELCSLASEACDVAFTPLHAGSYRELADGITRGDVGVAWMPPLPAIELEASGAAAALVLSSRQEGTSYYSAIVTREGKAKTLAELEGMRVAWVERESAAGYLVPRLHLASQGRDAKSFFAQESFAHSHLGVVDAVASGAADVGATFCTLDPVTKRVVTAGWMAADGSKIRNVELVTTLGPIPNDAIVVASSVPASVRSSLTRWFLSPDERTQELFAELFQVSSFRVASAAHFEPLRHRVRAARARGHHI
ncbi:MAG TPA: PhnD/SsuA/transferrin family substrate-binding protein [Polyangiaceae bacterium]